MHYSSTTNQVKKSTLFSLLLALIPITLLLLWIYSAEKADSHAEVLFMYLSYFPAFLNGRSTLTILSVLFSFTAILLSASLISYSQAVWKVLNVLIMITSSVILLLNLWSLL